MVNKLINDFKRSFVVRIALSYAFIMSGFIVNLLQLVTFILVWPFDKLLYRKIIYFLSYSLYSNVTSLSNWWCGTPLKIYASDQDAKMFGKENAFLVFNHKYDIDWIVGSCMMQMMGLMGGAKVIAKNALKYVPVIGWSWFFSEFIFIRREWEKDKELMTRELNSIFNFPKGFYYSITTFCEGTRFTREKHEESMKVAREKGLPELKHHLLPRTRGFYLMTNQLAGKIDYLYDVNLAIKDVDGHSPNIGDIVKGTQMDAQVYVRRIPMSAVPFDDEKKCAQFLNKLYQEKDEIFDVFYRTGNFEAVGDGVKRQDLPRNKYDLYCTLFWLAVTLLPTLYYLINFVWTGTWMLKFSFLISVILVNVLINYMMGKSDSAISGSKFGLSGPSTATASTSSRSQNGSPKKNT